MENLYKVTNYHFLYKQGKTFNFELYKKHSKGFTLLHSQGEL
jgi:hypothetical protein